MEKNFRMWLRDKESSTDVLAWNLHGQDIQQTDKKYYSATLTIRIGNTQVVLHPSDSVDDDNLSKFRNKLCLLNEKIDEFLKTAPFYIKGKPRTERLWLNPETGKEALFTGSVCLNYATDSCMLSIASCDRSFRFYVYPSKHPNDPCSDQKILFKMRVGIMKLIKEIDKVS